MRRANSTPEEVNSKYRHHHHLKKADANYIQGHALASAFPHTGHLPSSLKMDREFIQTVEQGIDPPSSHWGNLPVHMDSHYHAGSRARWYAQVFQVITGNSLRLIGIVEGGKLLTPEDSESLRDNIAEYQHIFLEDATISYESLPYFLLVYWNLLAAAVQITTAPAVQREFDSISFLLTYPVKDEHRTRYSLNARYMRSMDVGEGVVRPRHFLSGYRLGESRLIGTGSQYSLFLAELQISTLHSNFDVAPNSTDRPGLMCHLDFTGS